MAEEAAAGGGGASSSESAASSSSSSSSDSGSASSGGESSSSSTDSSTSDSGSSGEAGGAESAPDGNADASAGDASAGDAAAENSSSDTAANESSAESATPDAASGEQGASAEQGATEGGTTESGATAEQGAEQQPGSPAAGEHAEGEAGAEAGTQAGAQTATEDNAAAKGAKGEAQSSVEQEVLSAVPPPDPQPLHELQDGWNGVAKGAQAAGDEVRRQDNDMPGVWGGQGGEAMGSRLGSTTQQTDDLNQAASDVANRAGVTAGDFANTRAQMVDTAKQAGRDAQLASTLQPSQAEADVATRQLTANAIRQNADVSAAMRNKVDVDWDDYLDPRREDPVRDRLIDLVNRTGEAVQDAGRWLLTVEPEGPDANFEPEGPADGKFGSVAADALADHGKWHALGGLANGEYSAGLYGSGQANMPGSDKPLLEVEAQAGVKANLDKMQVVDTGPLDVSIEPEVRAGPGYGFEFDPKFEDGKFSLHAKGSASPLVGGGLGLDVDIDTNEIMRSLDSIRRGLFGG